MRKVIITIIGLITLFTISGCENSIDQYKFTDLKVKKIAEVDKNYSVSITALSNKIDKNENDNSIANIGSYVINNDNIYFVVNNEVKGDVMVSGSELYEYNITNDKIRKIYSIIGGKGYLGISTLETSSDHLFWIEEKEMWEIKSYEIETEKVSVVDKKSNTQVSPNISVVGELLCWYKIDDMKSNKIDLITYNTKDKKVKSLCNDNIYLSNAYSKIPNSNRYILYITKKMTV